MSVARLAELLNDRMGDLAVSLLGSPNRELSSQQQLRFGIKAASRWKSRARMPGAGMTTRRAPAALGWN